MDLSLDDPMWLARPCWTAPPQILARRDEVPAHSFSREPRAESTEAVPVRVKFQRGRGGVGSRAGFLNLPDVADGYRGSFLPYFQL